MVTKSQKHSMGPCNSAYMVIHTFMCSCFKTKQSVFIVQNNFSLVETSCIHLDFVQKAMHPSWFYPDRESFGLVKISRTHLDFIQRALAWSKSHVPFLMSSRERFSLTWNLTHPFLTLSTELQKSHACRVKLINYYQRVSRLSICRDV